MGRNVIIALNITSHKFCLLSIIPSCVENVWKLLCLCKTIIFAQSSRFQKSLCLWFPLSVIAVCHYNVVRRSCSIFLLCAKIFCLFSLLGPNRLGDGVEVLSSKQCIAENGERNVRCFDKNMAKFYDNFVSKYFTFDDPMRDHTISTVHWSKIVQLSFGCAETIVAGL